ncbi:MAG TPA: hypothetical protein DCR97_11910 [Deltaproteobacteria bacterium]|nr:hypothetical protein [Deltaproteobacteria bacterium]
MDGFEILFVGYLGTYTVVPFAGPSFVESGGPAFYCSMTACRLRKGVALATRASDHEAHLVDLLKRSGIHLFVQQGQTPRYRAVFPTANVDERQVFLEHGAAPFKIDDLPPVEPCIVHLAGWHIREFSLEFMEALKGRGFRVSVDMQAFLYGADQDRGYVRLVDLPEKKEILGTADFVKLDGEEAKTLTGTDVLEDQVEILEAWGSKETVITHSRGVLARREGRTSSARFTNKGSKGRMGRGDTVIAAYLIRRLDHNVEESLSFAAALTSMKLEYPGPFRGSLEEVMAIMGG